MEPVKNRVAPASAGDSPGRSRPGIPAWKRLLDLACVLFALPVAGPLLFLIAIGIKMVSKGPALFCQRRIGYRGKPFICLKFRTMRAGADTAIHEGYFKELMHSKRPMMKLDSYGDSRLIPLGSLLRCSGLDELPQLFNVWRGDMSLVGPRPCTPNEYEDYLPWQKQRFNAPPGLTGLWQVSGKNRTTFDEMIQLDIAYAQKLSLWLDLKIMFKTFPVLVTEVREMLGRRRLRSKVVRLRSESEAAMRSTNGHEAKTGPNSSQLAARVSEDGQYSSRHGLAQVGLAKGQRRPDPSGGLS